MENLWVCHDSVDPIRSWELCFQGLDKEQRFTLLDSLGELGDESGVFTISAFRSPGVPLSIKGAQSNQAWASLARQHEIAEILPFYDLLQANDSELVITSTVGLRRPGVGIVTERQHDAGGLLREIESQQDESFYRRFAARRPFLGLWSETSAHHLSVTCASWTDLWFDDEDPELLRINGTRFMAFLEGLQALATSLGGSLREHS